MKVIKSSISVVSHIYRRNYPLIKTEVAAIKMSAGSVVSSEVWLGAVGFTHMIVSSIGFSQNCWTEGLSFLLAIE